MIFQFGNIALYIDNPYFFVGFQRGRELYARDCQLVPARKLRLSVTEVMRYVAVPDEKTGHWHFDAKIGDHVEEYLGVFLGYLYSALPASDQSKG